ncbi:MAG: hypothetical protein IIB46_02120 [Nitrospinae bacterium]|nr:hypothetical protein [Nitrospinota bacterium]
MVSDFLKPIAEKIQDVLGPIKPLVDILTKTIPGLDFLLSPPNMMGLINFLIVLDGGKPINWAFVDAVVAAFRFVDTVNAMLTSSGEILLGNIMNYATDDMMEGYVATHRMYAARDGGIAEVDIAAHGAQVNFTFQVTQLEVAAHGLSFKMAFNAGDVEIPAMRLQIDIKFSRDSDEKVDVGGGERSLLPLQVGDAVQLVFIGEVDVQTTADQQRASHQGTDDEHVLTKQVRAHPSVLPTHECRNHGPFP